MTALDTAFLATTPVLYYPLDETSGTVANEQVSNADGTCVGMVMGGSDMNFEVGGLANQKCAVFTGGTEHIVLGSAAILGGQTAWTVAAWIRFNGLGAVSRHFYGEAKAASGNDMVAAGLIGDQISTGIRAEVISGVDSGSTTFRAGDLTLKNPPPGSVPFWAFLVYRRNGTTLDIWKDGQLLGTTNTGPAGNTWTDTSILSWLGANPRTGTSPWVGNVRHLGLWTRYLSDVDCLALYEASTPVTRPLLDTKIFTNPKAWMNQDLTDVGNPPTIVTGSVWPARLAAQVAGYGTAINYSTGPMYVTSDASAVQRVRIQDGVNSIQNNPPGLYAALGLTRPPPDFATNDVSDTQASIYNPDDGTYFEFIQIRPQFTRTSSVLVVEGSGAVPAGDTGYYIAGAQADGKTGHLSDNGLGKRITLTGAQAVRVTWNEIEGVDHYRVYRSPPGVVAAYLIALVPSGTLTFRDGGIPLGVAWPGPTMDPTADYGCDFAGYVADCSTYIGYYPNPPLMGATATQLPLWAGSISIHEGQILDIDHGLAIGLPEVEPAYHYHPAQRNDGYGGGNAIPEGTRFQLLPAFDVNTISGPLAKAAAIAAKKYGMVVRDVTQVPSIYAEDQFNTGRDLWSDILEGRTQTEAFSDFPWGSLRVVDPAWTLAQEAGEGPPAAPTKWATFTEEFTTFDTSTVWQISTGSATLVNGTIRLDPDPYTIVNTRAPHDLLESSVSVDLGESPTTGGAYAEGEAEIRLVNGSLTLTMGIFDPAPSKVFMQAVDSGGANHQLASHPTFDPVVMRFWRIRETAGTIYFETSPNNVAWTTRGSFIRADLGHAEVVYQSTVLWLLNQAYGASPPPLPDFIISGVNTAAPPPVVEEPKYVKLNVMVMDPARDTYEISYIDADALFSNLTTRDPLP